MRIIYRTFEPTDLSSLLPLMAQLGYALSEERLQKNITAVRHKGGEIFVAEQAGKVLGCVCAIIDIRLAEGCQGEIVSLVVSEEARGLGLGKGLVLSAEKWLFQQVDTIRVRANQVRKDAHQFYQRMGYKAGKTQLILDKRTRPSS